jgi:hypothetical protein
MEYYREERKGKRAYFPAITDGVWAISHDATPTLVRSGRVQAALLKTEDEKIYSIRGGTHLQLMQLFELDPNSIVSTGWRLTDGTEIWR